ncbi:MAG: NADH-ubiquinone oxidoreductase-F iron-sulfur binding region domain-containing protein [Bacteroidales bacterium]|nr:NADH-ubiquinone oxidoreductase-F iron-sulfur binding region domain-containing protein [Bacteroidales bacterium]
MTNLQDKTYKALFIDSTELKDKPQYPKPVEIPHIYVERNTGSIVSGVDTTIQYIKKYFDNKDSYKLIETGSLGISSFDPVIGIQIHGRPIIFFKNLTFSYVSTILDSILNHILPESKFILGQISNTGLSSWNDVPELFQLDIFAKQNRRILKNFGFIQPESIKSYMNYDGYKAFAKTITKQTAAEVCNIIENSGLRGRGGGAFNTGMKWQQALNTSKSQKYFICNADESDPGSFSGRLLAESNPHLVIEGMLISAYAIHAQKAYIYIRNTYTLAIDRLNNALSQAKKAGLIGEDIFGSGINIEIEIFKGPGAYVCGEETALIASMEGERGTPKPKPPYPSEDGLFGYPTVVNNIETVCNVPYIINHGVDEFKKAGSNNSFGTKLFSISGKTDITGVIEVDLGCSVDKVVDICITKQGKKNIKAIHIGGPSGGFIAPDNFSINLDYETIFKNNLWLGSGSFLLLDKTNCIIDITKYFIKFVNNESCGKCIPCREGSQRLLEILNRISEKPSDYNKHESLLRFKGVTQLEQISSLMQKTSLCGLGQNAPNTILSGLQKFRQEYEEHIYERTCKANVCRNLKEYFVIVDNCVGCGICAKKCPTDAIIGTEHQAHFIIQDRCIKCGVCEASCKFNAIMIK